MTLTKKNLIANFASSLILGLTAFIFIPIYLKQIGIAGFGLVGFQTTLVASLSLFDLGFGSAIIREVARISDQKNFEEKLRDFIFSFELFFWIGSLFLALAVYALAPYISGSWLSSKSLDTKTIEMSISLMAVALFFQFPVSLYTGCLIGLEKQIGYNLINIVFSLLRYGGAALVAVVYNGDLFAFFSWQIIVVFANVLAMKLFLWHQIKGASRPQFNKFYLQSVWKFAAAMGVVNLLGLLLNQVDKVIVSKLLNLEQLGYYTIAWTVAGLITKISTPVFNAIYPKLTKIYASQDQHALKEFYQKSTQSMAVFVIPAATFIIVFSKTLLTMWLNKVDLVDQVQRPTLLLVSAALMGGVFLMPYSLSLAAGKTKTVLAINSISLLLFIPSVILSIIYLNEPALGWFILNLFAIVFGNYFYVKDILDRSLLNWYWESLFLPALISVSVYLVLKRVFDIFSGPYLVLNLLLLGVIALIGLTITAMALSKTRKMILGFPLFKKRGFE